MRGAGYTGIRFGIGMLLAASGAFSSGACAQGLRGDVAVTESAPAPHIARIEKQQGRQVRNYPEQPPLIPHSIAGYEITVRANRCLACHSRQRTVASGAPMPSVTHFMDRDLQVLSDISARRYFCTQCHVSQTAAVPPVENHFIDAAQLGGESGAE